MLYFLFSFGCDFPTTVIATNGKQCCFVLMNAVFIASVMTLSSFEAKSMFISE